MLHSLFRLIVWLFRVYRKFSSILPSPPVCSKSGTSPQKSYFIPEPFDTFFSASCSLISLIFSLFLARSQALELEHLSRESEENATRYGPERANLLLHSPPVSSLAFYNAFLPVFARLHFCTRAHIALARVFLENRGLLLWGRPTDGLRNRRCSLTVCRGASAAPPSRLVLPPLLPSVPLSTVSLYPSLSSSSSSRLCLLLRLLCVSAPLSRSRTHAAQVFKSSCFDRFFLAIANFSLSNPTRKAFPTRSQCFQKKERKKQYNLRSDEKERGRVRN